MGTTTNGVRAYVANMDDGSVSVIDPSIDSVIDTITTDIGTAPQAVAISPDGSKVYVGNVISGGISVIDTATNLVTATVTDVRVESDTVSLAISPNGQRLYVADSGYRVHAYNTPDNSYAGSTAANGGEIPQMVVTPDSTTLIVPTYAGSVSNGAARTFDTAGFNTVGENPLLQNIFMSLASAAGVAINPAYPAYVLTSFGMGGNPTIYELSKVTGPPGAPAAPRGGRRRYDRDRELGAARQ